MIPVIRCLYIYSHDTAARIWTWPHSYRQHQRCPLQFYTQLCWYTFYHILSTQSSRLSRSLEVVGTVTDRSVTCNFLLVIRITKPWAYLVPFPSKTAISVENRNFFHPVYLTPPLREFLLNFVTAVALKKIRVMSLPDGQQSLTICAFVEICDGQMDGFAKPISRCAGRACWRAVAKRLWAVHC